MVPKGWKVVDIEKCLKDSKSLAYGILQPGANIENGVPMIRTVDIGNNGLSGTNIINVSKELHQEYKRTALEGGEVLLSIMGTVGRTMVVPQSCKGWNVNRALAVIRLNELVDASYFSEYLKSPFINDRLVEQAIGSAQKRINLGDLRKYQLNIPPLPEQQKIAKILSTWDKAISTTERLIENSTQQKSALMQQLLTGKKRLVDDEGQRFAGEWEERAVSSFGKVITGSTPPKNDSSNYDGNISWATAEDFKRKYVSNTKIKLTESGAAKARVVPKGSVLVTCIASIGKNAIANESLATNQQINSVAINKNNSNEFFYYLIEFNTHKLLAWAGTTAVPILNKTSFEKVKFIVPNLKEQQKIATVLTNADKEIELLEQQLADLQQEKKALMQVLLTGKKRVVVDGEVA